jgi:hypothetical protein
LRKRGNKSLLWTSQSRHYITWTGKSSSSEGSRVLYSTLAVFGDSTIHPYLLLHKLETAQPYSRGWISPKTPTRLYLGKTRPWGDMWVNATGAQTKTWVQRLVMSIKYNVRAQKTFTLLFDKERLQTFLEKMFNLFIFFILTFFSFLFPDFYYLLSTNHSSGS